MKSKITNSYFKQLQPDKELGDFVEIYWKHFNSSDEQQEMTISPDSFFKLIVQITDSKIEAFYMTGIWSKEIELVIPPRTAIYGIKFKVLAPEYIFRERISSILDSRKDLDIEFLNIAHVNFDTLENVAQHFNTALIKKLKQSKLVDRRKLQLSQILYQTNGNISAQEVSKQIYWENRQINRYLNKYLGVSLKKYLNMQKIYAAYIQIREGQFFPEEGYYDQPHFIRETKKYTGKTPKELFEEQNDRFIQLKNIQKK